MSDDVIHAATVTLGMLADGTRLRLMAALVDAESDVTALTCLVGAARRPSRKAKPSGTAVSASATLCSVSPSSATEPDNTTISACATAVAPSTPSEIHSARMPSRDDSMAESTLSALSCECGVIR